MKMNIEKELKNISGGTLSGWLKKVKTH